MAGKIVLTTGAFDMLHPGHVKLLEEAKRLAGSDGKLVVLIARDETVRRNKGRDPIFDEESRRYMVSMLKPVDEVILGYTPPSFEKVIERVRPDIVVFGYDQEKFRKEFERFCREKGIDVDIVVARKYSLGRLNSSTEIIERILKLYNP
ncbi:MAG: nucleotidyltransferase [Thaumarchaeota archaeon]|nr:MAG: nucleotidyltransferase [Nitrososphaerota archaeon]